MKEEVNKWIGKAKSDLKHAKSSLRNGEFDWAQVASQQAAEKALKAVCLHKGIGLIKVHDLTILGRKLNAPNDVLENCGLLNPFYTASRYPDVQERTNKKLEEIAAKDAIKAAEKVIRWCKEQIKI
ncbi:HEPN domain-containing protein [Candidatus Woesearchaeota archaeon]|nr:HEPN domain-containing protein [Candidatus Woesearchaeota archaeon]